MKNSKRFRKVQGFFRRIQKVFKKKSQNRKLPHETLIEHLKESAAKHYKLNEKYQIGIGHQFEYEQKDTSLYVTISKDGKKFVNFNTKMAFPLY